jgi:hypothetical protein
MYIVIMSNEYHHKTLSSHLKRFFSASESTSPFIAAMILICHLNLVFNLPTYSKNAAQHLDSVGDFLEFLFQFLFATK